jgi:hypothetical protein
MITEIEMAEYRKLCVSLAALHEKFLKKRQQLKDLLEKTNSLRKNAILVLAKANRLTRHLTGRQRQIAGLSYHLGELKARICQENPLLSKSGNEELETLPEIREDFKNRRELKQNGLALIAMIDEVKKKILQLDLLEMRCRELILSINKALDAFRHESGIIHRRIYPFGFFSLAFRYLRKIWGKSYFSYRDLEGLGTLGNITGLVLKIADSPLL